ncbi:MAG: Ig-like domain-containing protein [Oscillospiraceae bacterium]|nr:Ig-like domain-containing protein [Oscillospiraceae bacterium]
MNEYPQFNDWRATRSLGTGKVGETFEIVRSDSFGTTEQGVLKLIRVPAEDTLEAQQAQRRRLEAVAQTLRAADELAEHPNVLPWREHIIRSAEDGSGWEICLRASTAVPLEQYIRTHTYGERDVVSMISGVLTALSICHSRGVIHGDIKPQNLFVGDAGYDGKPVLKLGDFGNAPLVPDAAGDFASPEVLCGDPVSAQHDLYSLGMVLYWLLNDKRVPYAPPAPAPVSAADLAIARDMRLRGDPMPVPAHGSTALQSVIMTAIADRPEDRFHSAEEVRDALQGVVQAADERRAREERAARAAAMEAQALQQARAREARMSHVREEEEEEPKRSVLPIVIGSICGLIVLGLALLLIFSSIGSKDKAKDEESEISYLKMSQTEVEVAPDDKVSLTCVAYDKENQEVSDAEIVWSTSDQSIATVNTNGEVTGHAEGDATIKAAVKGDDEVDAVSCKVTVTKDAVKVEKIKLSEESKTMEVDETFHLTYDLTPAKASAGDVKWSSSDKDVATVDDDGLVKAVGPGTTTIKVTVSNGVNDKELSASCVVQVSEKAKVKRVIANNASMTLTGEGDSKQISFTVSGKNVDDFSGSVSIKAEDGSIIQVNNIQRTGSGDSNTYTVTVTALRGGITDVNFVITDSEGEHAARTTISVNIPFTPDPEPPDVPTSEPIPDDEPPELGF